jgi:hypothetical protein
MKRYNWSSFTECILLKRKAAFNLVTYRQYKIEGWASMDPWTLHKWYQMPGNKHLKCRVTQP